MTDHTELARVMADHTDLAKRVREAAKTIQDLRLVDPYFLYHELCYEGKELGFLLSESAKRVEVNGQLNELTGIIIDHYKHGRSDARRVAQRIIDAGFRSDK